VSLLCFPYQKLKHSRDTTVLIDLLWFNVVYYSSLFQYFFSIYYGPYSSWKFLIFLAYLYLKTFSEGTQQKILQGFNWTHFSWNYIILCDLIVTSNMLTSASKKINRNADHDIGAQKFILNPSTKLLWNFKIYELTDNAFSQSING